MTTLKGLQLAFPVVGQYIVAELFAAPRPYVAWGLKYQHEGIDIAPLPVTRDARACAAYAGAVSGVGRDEEFMGTWVELFHNYEGAGFWTRYHHLRRAYVSPGGYRLAGDQIGLIGDTGYATGVHLHFMLLVERAGRRVAIDPLPFFPQSVRNSIKARG